MDLAGSENARTAGSTGEQLKEGAAINKSLLTLGRVIKALSAAAGAAQRSGLSRRRSSLQSGDHLDDARANSPPPRRVDIATDGPGTTASPNGARRNVTRRASVGGPATPSRSNSRGLSLGSTNGSVSGPLVLAPPYRDSILTYLLKDSLGGNSKTTLVATIRPEVCYQEETGVTLAYASQARTIVNIVHVNENPFVAAIKTVCYCCNVYLLNTH